MYKLMLHKHAQCGFDGYSSENHRITFYSYDTPVYSVEKIRYDDDVEVIFKVINQPVQSTTTAKQTTWSIYEQIYNHDCARYVRELMQKAERGVSIVVIQNFELKLCRVYVGHMLIKDFSEV